MTTRTKPKPGSLEYWLEWATLPHKPKRLHKSKRLRLEELGLTEELRLKRRAEFEKYWPELAACIKRSLATHDVQLVGRIARYAADVCLDDMRTANAA